MQSMSIRSVLEYTLHPFLLLGAMTIWFVMDDVEAATLTAFIVAQLVLRLVEMTYPAHSDWKQSGKELLIVLGLALFGLGLIPVVNSLYADVLAVPLGSIRETLGTNIWPRQWPMWTQVLLMYFASEFIFYWIHRGIHNSSFLWRLSGHGFHHSFKNMHAINFLTSHPFELFFLALPVALISLLFGATSEAVLGSALLIVVNAGFAHANIRTRNPWMGLLFTTSDQHRRHHSNVFAESNTNYSCNAIIWDRLFATYSSGDIKQTGIGPIEPSLVEKFLLPVRQGESVRTAPGNK